MDRIRVLFVQEKKIKKGKVITLGDLVEKEVPDTYEMDYISAKENILDKVKKFDPQILFIAQCKAYDVFDLVKRVKGIKPDVIVLVNLTMVAESEQEAVNRLKGLGVYKCYSSALSVDSLIHDMFVSMNME